MNDFRDDYTDKLEVIDCLNCSHLGIFGCLDPTCSNNLMREESWEACFINFLKKEGEE